MQKCSKLNAIQITLFLFLIVITGCSMEDKYQAITRVSNFDDLVNNFSEPHQDYGTAPLYVWNGIITKERIEEDLIKFKEAGFGGVFVHPRPGLITEYLSDNWFELFAYTVEKAKELKLNVWIYDENSYPSGFAGGHVPAEMPESYNHGQGLQPKDTNIVPTNYKDYFLIYEKSNGKYINVTDIADQKVGKEGDYSLISKTYYRTSEWFGGWSYVDLVYPGVTEKFIDLTMSGYINVAKEDFGKSVKGVFTDEPEIGTPGGVRWTPDLFDVFKNQWGYDLKENFPSLYKEIGDWKKVRHNYTQTMLQLFIERWSKPQYKFSEENNLIFTGHYWEHGWPSMKLGGDNMAMYAYHQMPGIDMLFNQFNEQSNKAQFGNIRAVKELASVANQLGRHRTLSETYGGGGWEETFEDFKRLGDWEYVFGVNFMNQHLSHYTLAGARKYDYPPSFSYHTPYWKQYKYLNDYYKRLSFVMSSGKQINNILVIEPTTTAWLYDSYVKDAINKKNEEIGLTFQEFVTKLEKNQVEYDLGSEDIIKNHGKVNKAKFVVDQRSYSLVVVPPLVENLNKSTYDLLVKYIQNGGQVLSFSSPKLVDGEFNQNVADLFSNNNGKVKFANSLTNEVISDHFRNEKVQFNFEGGNFYHHRRKLDDGQILFMVNSSLEKETSGDVIIDGKDALMLNAFNGNIKIYPCETTESGIKMKFTLYPAESLLLFIPDSPQEGYQHNESSTELEEVASNSEIKISRLRDNVLTIDFCDLRIDGEEITDLNVYDAGKKVFQSNGFEDGNPWNHSVQYKTSVLDKANFSDESGFSAIYNFTINDKFDYSKLKVVIERPQTFNVSINGEKISSTAGEWWLDKEFGVFMIGDFVRQGLNRIEIKCQPMNIHGEIEPLYIVGDFSVNSMDKGWSISAPYKEMKMKSWKDQGMPFYSWDVSYSKVFEISSLSSKYFIEVSEWKGTVISVNINGEDAGIIALHSDKIDITDQIKTGKNKVFVTVVGSLKNLLGPHHKNPKPGLVSPWHWRGTEGYPPGSEYQILDYGLFGDIRLLHQSI